ncbi:sulfurtransferase [Xylocopilactobacillus apicola]|uniref:Sulfurtransferase n=1 Tax=Xylocopilactobacillus apicola TaxID=2932184 RepID=A0AAU9DVZ3_9LACO|nr:rhodanese-like domain-containing protein [Xylocopilactobacillus apicola]BDR59648.1 hypothetical protein XA3_20890 [Xylocopilactobacillus apicola]
MKKRNCFLVFAILLVSLGAGQEVLADCKTGSNSEKPASSTAANKNRLVKTTKSHYYIDVHDAYKEIKDNPKAVVLETSYGKKTSYAKGHLPRAVQMDTLEVETEENDWNILDFDSCKKAFLEKGVTKDTPLLVYSEDPLSSARIAFVAYWLGVKDVKIVDGGLNAWKNEKLTLQKGTLKPKAQKNFGRSKPAHPEDLISTSADLVKYEKDHPKLVIASTRSWDEFVGNISGYSYIKDTGEVKGAKYAKVSKTSSDVSYLMNSDLTMTNPEKTLKYWNKNGITPSKEVAFYCGTGWRACPAFFIAKDNGYKKARIFDGGWYEWDRAHEKNPSEFPVQKGDPANKKTFQIITKPQMSY